MDMLVLFSDLVVLPLLQFLSFELCSALGQRQHIFAAHAAGE